MRHSVKQVPQFELVEGGVRCSGEWVLSQLPALQRALARSVWPNGALLFELEGITALDSAGAWLLQRTLRQLEQRGSEVSCVGLAARFTPLFAAVASHSAALQQPPPAPRDHLLVRLGAQAVVALQQYQALLSFFGEMMVALLLQLRHPRRFRWRLLLHHIGEAGYQALPIIGLLSFLLGVVIAYQGGDLLRQYGAEVFIADLVGLSLLRELAPLMAAVIVAGRTGSAFAAQIGTMRVTEEVSALQVIGLHPMEVLVIPKLLALMLSLTLLTLFADLMGVLGGMVIAQAVLGISPVTFIARVGEAVTLASFVIGVGKAPIFAAIIAWVGCFQGFQVSAGAEMVGRRTTAAVVQSIFLVIVVDAIFSVMFSELGI